MVSRGRVFLNNTHRYAPRAVTRITLRFNDIPDKEIYHKYNKDGTLKLTFEYSYSSKKRKLFFNDQRDLTTTEEFIRNMKEDIDYIYIPTHRGNKDLSKDNDSIFQRIISLYSEKYLESRDNFSSRLSRLADSFKESILNKIEMELGNKVLSGLREKYIIEYSSKIDYSVFLDKIDLFFQGKKEDYPVTEYGSGIQSLTVIILYRLLAHLTKASVIFGIEEPETNLHPQAQRKLIYSILEERKDDEVQAIITTHSTVIIDELKHEDIILARRVEDKNRGFITKFTQINENFWLRHKIPSRDEEFIRYKNSEIFFSKYVVIVEGPADEKVVRYLIRDELKNNIFDVGFLVLNGIPKMKYPYFLLKELEMPFSMVLDKDSFVDYSENNNLEKSRDSNFLPKYSNELKIKNDIIDDIWNSKIEKEKVNEALSKSYSQFFDVCAKKKVFPMTYCLEMDLVANKKTRESFCELFELDPADPMIYQKLLRDNKKAIKKEHNLIKVLDDMNLRDLPYSFKKIRKELLENINTVIKD